MGLGRVYPGDPNEPFCMTVLALKLSRHANGVSALHGSVSRRMWHPLYPQPHRGGGADRPHHQRRPRPELGRPPDARCCSTATSAPTGQAASAIPRPGRGSSTIDDAELWETQQVLKARLIDFVREPAGGPGAAPRRARRGRRAGARRRSTSNALTIGFARRFATYKRAGLVLRDVERLAEIVDAADRPIQIIFAGKAHPEDRLRQGADPEHRPAHPRRPRSSAAIVFVEDYDMNVARHLVQGVDVWLNNPRRPQEASGTSGEKAVLNGALNFSILDGWWAEAYDGTNGFAIGVGQTHAVPSVQDERDHDALIETLINQVVPLYYDRDATGLPRGWIARQKNALRTLAWRFNADRMVMDYVPNSYLPAAGGISCQMIR